MSEDEAERETQFAQWGMWFGQLGSAVVDAAAVGSAKTVLADGSVRVGGSREVNGYSIVEAESIDRAIELAKGCPLLGIGGSVDVSEVMAM